MIKSVDEQIEILTRGAQQITPEGGLRAKLEKSKRTGKPLIIKLGLDPTAPDIHLGFAVVLRKMRQFQDCGHQVVIIIGDFTAFIGDPTGRSKTRKQLTREEINENAKTYVEQLSVILDPNKTTVRHNSEWLDPLRFEDIIRLTSKLSVARMMERDDFTNRFREGVHISLHELLYPLAQAYDSVAIEADIEMGGTDQMFNILVGRDLQRELGQEEQIGFFMPLLVGLDGKEKMSKSLGNYIGIKETPSEQYGKTMSLPDELMEMYFTLCTDVPLEEVKLMMAECASGATNPKLVKQRLGREIVRIYHGDAAARDAEEEFTKVFSRHQTPEEIADVAICDAANMPAYKLLQAAGLVGSSSEGRRAIEGSGVYLNDSKVIDPSSPLEFRDGDVLRIGRRKYARLRHS